MFRSARTAGHIARAAACGCALLAAQAVRAGIAVTRPVSVQAVTPDSVTIVWHTQQPASAVVEFGPTLEYGASAETKTRSTQHAVTLHRLRPGQEYYYRVRCDSETLYAGPEYHFRALPDKRTDRFRFLVFGDSGKGNAAQYSLVPGLVSAQPDFVLHVGDVIYPAGEPEDFDPKFFLPYQELLRTTPMWLALGNHDVMTQNGQPYLDAFFLPRNPSGSERYYSFNYGKTHITVLDSNAPFDSTVLDWLHRDLASATTTWKFVTLHHPMYSCGMHGSSIDLRHTLGPIFEEHGVDIVFCGHDHDYQRSHPMRAGAVVDAEQSPHFVRPRGVLYIVTGGGEAPRSTSSSCSFTAAAISATHFTQVDVEGTHLELRAVSADGRVLDAITIDKPARGALRPQAPEKPPLPLAGSPNPFNPSTTLQYRLEADGPVTLTVYDLAGREVRRLQRGPMAAGEHRVTWDGCDERGSHVSSGAYLVRLQTALDAVTCKVVLAK